MSETMNREVLLVPHLFRASNIDSAARATELLQDAGVTVRLLEQEQMDAIETNPVLSGLTRAAANEGAAAGCELVLVLGGDGTFLRAASYARAQDIPVLGINLGHVGFLAEGEAASLEKVVGKVIDRSYRVVDRMTLDVAVIGEGGEVLGRNWALNECSIENSDRSRVLDATLEVDFRPVSSFGCDGVLISTPTGSTAYAFSAGGPVMWPQLDAILVVPNNAHALFAKPLVVAPTSTVAVESERNTTPATAVMDGQRRLTVPAGSRVEVVRGERPVRWVRLDDRPFTDRLVDKFQLPVSGWRGPRGA